MDLNIPMPKSIEELIAKLSQSGNLAGAANLAGQMSLRQALYDILGTYPGANVMPYHYNFKNLNNTNNAIPAGGTEQNSIKITAEAAFIATDLRVKSTGAFRIFYRMDASDRQLLNEAIDISTIAGTAQRPGFYAKPLLLPANTTISFDLTDTSGAENEVEFSMNGYKVYDFNA